MVLFDGSTPPTEDGIDTPAEEVVEDVDTKKVDRVMKVFEKLGPQEQQAAFTRMEEIIGAAVEEVATEGDLPPAGDLGPGGPGGPNPLDLGGGAPLDAGLPLGGDQATGSPFNALQDKLKNI